MRYLVTTVALLLLFSGCADTVSYTIIPEYEAVGFWYGLWHGAILFISFVVSLFDESVSVYAVYNSGGWYDFGYLLGVMIAFGGSKKTYHQSCKIAGFKNGARIKATIDVEEIK